MLPQLDSVVLYLTLTAVCQSKVRYRTASDSDRPFIKSVGRQIKSVGRQQKAGRYHHPKRAARLGTPVRSRFCNDGSLLLPTLDRDTAPKVFLVHVMDPLSGSLCDLRASVVRVSLRPELAKTTTTRYNSGYSLIAPISCCAPVAQRLEQQTHNLLVRGSNPCGGTKYLVSVLTLFLLLRRLTFLRSHHYTHDTLEDRSLQPRPPLVHVPDCNRTAKLDNGTRCLLRTVNA